MALRRLLQALDDAHADRSLVWIFQDGHERSVESVIAEFHPVKLIRVPPPQHQNESSVLTSRLTFNYRFMIDYAFSPSVMVGKQAAAHVIVLEDDLMVAPDIVRFFSEASAVLDADPSLYCVSSYNDNAFWSSSRDESLVLRGEHFMALGWMTSKHIYDTEIRHRWMMDHVWDTPWAMIMNSPPPHLQHVTRECLFPAVPRTSHPGDPATKAGALTTSRILQRLHFDHIRLATCEECGLDFAKTSAAAYEQEMANLLAEAQPITCPYSALHRIKGDAPPSAEYPLGVRVPAVVVLKTANDTDELWDVAMRHLNFFGRGPGFDRLPRGIHKGCVRSFFAGRELMFLGSHSGYRSSHPHLAAAEAADKKDLEECAEQALNTVPSVLSHLQDSPLRLYSVDSGAVSCRSFCEAVGQTCSVDAMVLMSNCKWLSAHNLPDEEGDQEITLQGKTQIRYRDVTNSGSNSEEGGCDGCGGEWGDVERELGAVIRAPSWRSDSGECLVPSWAAVSCEGEEPPTTSRKFCGCE